MKSIFPVSLSYDHVFMISEALSYQDFEGIHKSYRNNSYSITNFNLKCSCISRICLTSLTLYDYNLKWVIVLHAFVYSVIASAINTLEFVNIFRTVVTLCA